MTHFYLVVSINKLRYLDTYSTDADSSFATSKDNDLHKITLSLSLTMPVAYSTYRTKCTALQAVDWLRFTG